MTGAGGGTFVVGCAASEPAAIDATTEISPNFISFR
jgi:hypothetical protein